MLDEITKSVLKEAGNSSKETSEEDSDVDFSMSKIQDTQEVWTELGKKFCKQDQEAATTETTSTPLSKKPCLKRNSNAKKTVNTKR